MLTNDNQPKLPIPNGTVAYMNSLPECEFPHPSDSYLEKIRSIDLMPHGSCTRVRFMNGSWSCSCSPTMGSRYFDIPDLHTRPPAEYHFLDSQGPAEAEWHFGCREHWIEHRWSVSLGVGRGQRLEVRLDAISPVQTLDARDVIDLPATVPTNEHDSSDLV